MRMSQSYDSFDKYSPHCATTLIENLKTFVFVPNIKDVLRIFLPQMLPTFEKGVVELL